MKRKIIFSIALTIFCFQFLKAEEETRPLLFGITGGMAYNVHTGTFGTTEGILDCGTFKDATSLRWLIGNTVDVSLSPVLGISGRIYYHNAGADFESQTASPPKISLNDGSVVYLNTNQTLETSVDYLNFEVLGRYNLTNNLYASLGPSLGIAVRANYSQYEEIVSPKGVNFIDGQPKRKIISGTFGESNSGKNKQLRLAAHLAVGGDFPLSSRIFINPELGYYLPFTKVITPSDWKISAFTATIGLKFAIGTDRKIIIEKEPAPLPKPEPVLAQKPLPKPVPVLYLQANNVLGGVEMNYSEILVEEDLSNEVVPLLPYIFFESNKSDLQTRYKSLNKSDITSFREENLRDSVIGIYHNLLNIVGRRMTLYPDAKISVSGYIDPTDDKLVAGNLASDRAITIKDYLVNNWGISSGRIVTHAGSLPKIVSNRGVEDGREENRRVEISSTDARILAPVKVNNADSKITPDAIVFKPSYQFVDKINKWELNISDAGGAKVDSKEGTNEVPSRINWDFNKSKMIEISRADNSKNFISAEYNIVTDSNSVSKAVTQIPVRRKVTSKSFNGVLVRDSIIERYNLIFFDFDKPQVSSFNESVVSLIHQRIRTNSSVNITGFTDRIGPKARNNNLSEDRAKEINEVVTSRIVPEQINYIGRGPTLIYNNDFPEGRFYNRTVIVEIATPIEK